MQNKKQYQTAIVVSFLLLPPPRCVKIIKKNTPPWVMTMMTRSYNQQFVFFSLHSFIPWLCISLDVFLYYYYYLVCLLRLFFCWILIINFYNLCAIRQPSHPSLCSTTSSFLQRSLQTHYYFYYKLTSVHSLHSIHSFTHARQTHTYIHMHSEQTPLSFGHSPKFR